MRSPFQRVFSVCAVGLFGLCTVPKRLRFQCSVFSIGAPGSNLPANQTDATTTTSSTDSTSFTTEILAFLTDEQGVGSGCQISKTRMQVDVDFPSKTVLNLRHSFR